MAHIALSIMLSYEEAYSERLSDFFSASQILGGPKSAPRALHRGEASTKILKDQTSFQGLDGPYALLGF